MIPSFRQDDGNTELRQLALLCLIHHNIPLNRSAYEFCDHCVTAGYLNNISTDEEGIRRHGGDLVSFASEKLMKHFHTWQNHEKDINQKNNKTNY
jgi:hypothetical protein|tara:strand:- start:2241 stop:2525 length:285 start_codon:yes stop_codon:yes gene_type:complete